VDVHAAGGRQVHERPGRAGQRARQHHRKHDRALFADAGVLRGAAVVAAGAQLVAEGGLVEQHVHHHGEGDGDQDAGVDAGHVDVAAGQVEEDLVEAALGDDGARRHVVGLVLGGVEDDRAADQEVDAVHADVVHHDRRDDLVDVEHGLEEAGHHAPQAARHHAREDADDPVEPRRQERPGAADPHRHRAADHQLAGRADVEQAGPEREANRQARHDQRRRQV